MNPTHSQIQVTNSESSPPSFVTTYTDSQDDNILVVPANALHVTSAQQSSIYSNTPQQTPALHPTVFYYQPPNDFYHYRVNCKEISYDVVESLLNKPLNGN